MEKKTKSAVVLMSGGVESAVVAHLARRDYGIVRGLFVNYGQRAADHERGSADFVCGKQGIFLQEVTLDIPFWGRATLVDSTVHAKFDPNADGAARAHIIAYRNLVILGLAASFAESFADAYETEVDVLTGFDFNPDNPGSARDKRPEFVEAVQQALNEAQERSAVNIVSPLNGFKKSDTVMLGVQLGVNWSETWSCYNDFDKHCGVCGSCVLRRAAFEEHGLVDPAGALSAEEQAEL